MLFLNNLDWSELILKNHFDIVSVRELVLTKYKDFILEKEDVYIMETITKYSIFDAKMDAFVILKDSLKSFHENNSTLVLNDKIMEILEKVHWESYMQTMDFQYNNLEVLKQLCAQQVSYCFQQDTVNVLSSVESIRFYEKEFLDRIIESLVIILLIIWVLPQTLYHSFFQDYIRNIAINIAQQIVSNVIARSPNSIVFHAMTPQEINDFFFLLITMGIKEQGVLGVFWTFAKIRYFW